MEVSDVVFGIHPPPKQKVDRSFSESSCSEVSLQPPHAMSIAYNSQSDFESGPWEDKLEELSPEVSSAWGNQRFTHNESHPRALLGETLLRSSEQRGAHPTFF